MPYKPEQPWERQDGESGQAYEAFAAYRDAGKSRTVSAVVKQLGKSRSLLDRWKTRWNWEDRVRAYDIHVEREAKEQAIKERKSMLKRHINIALNVQRKALEALDKLEVESMTPKDIKEYIRLATDLERLSRSFEEQKTEEAEAKNEVSLADAIMAAYQKRKDGESDD